MNSTAIAAMSTQMLNSPGICTYHRSPEEVTPETTYPPVLNAPTINTCGIANSHHLTSTRPRDNRSGYCTSNPAG